MTSALEVSIRRLTREQNGQYPRPWMTAMTRPEQARIFVVGYNQATGYCVASAGDHEAYINALFNRRGRSGDELYREMRGEKCASLARKNICGLRKRLSELELYDVIETNVICYSTPMSEDLRRDEHQGGKEKGREIFLEILRLIRPVVLIVHGSGANHELARALRCPIPSPPACEADGVSHARVSTHVLGELYSPIVFAIPSLAPPRWNSWQKWAEAHLDAVSTQVRSVLIDL